MSLKLLRPMPVSRKSVEAPVLRTLVVGEPDELRNTLKSDLKRVGVHVLGATDCQQMVQEAIRLDPDIVVILAPLAGQPLFAATSLLESLHPVAIAVFTEDVQVESMERAMESGIHAWVLHGYRADRLRPVLQLARVRFRYEQKQRAALASLAGRFEERKLVDRAKGILMDTGGMPEAQAYQVLRSAAMNRKVRLGQAAQRLIDAAHGVEAINLAGQLRMLSQRLVKLCLLETFDVEPQAARALRAVSVRRAEDNLAALEELLATLPTRALLDGVRAAWQALAAALEPGPVASSDSAPGAPPPAGATAFDLDAIDAAAQRLLDTAEHLTGALDAASGVAGCELVNLAGRQRMLAQRVVKRSLAGVRGPDLAPAAALRDALPDRADFEAALATLRAAPLTTAAEHTLLDEAMRSWITLRAHADQAHLPSAQRVLARSSEELLDLFDRLTENYEKRLKLMVG